MVTVCVAATAAAVAAFAVLLGCQWHFTGVSGRNAEMEVELEEAAREVNGARLRVDLAVAAEQEALTRVRERDAEWLVQLELRRVVVHTKDDRSIEGFVERVAVDGVILRTARYLDTQDVSMKGEVWIPRDSVSFVQTVPA